MPSGGIKIMNSPITVPFFSKLQFIYLSLRNRYKHFYPVGQEQSAELLQGRSSK
jgi:hypothetical protein